MSITNNLQQIRKTLSGNVTLVAVSKTKPITDILEAYHAGQRVFGENKIQEMTTKFEELPKDIKWHMIGHLQRNKIKYMAHYVDLIHGIDSFKTLKEINKQAKKHQRVIHCLLQVKIAQEDTKFGLSFSEIEAILNTNNLKELENIKISGFMGMASFTNNQVQVKKEFLALKKFFDSQKVKNSANIDLQTLSMGMSSDYQLAIDCGSSMVRVGSAVFGSRKK